MLKIGLISLFPTFFDCLQYGIPGRALQQQRAQLFFWNPRDYAKDKHRTVDDRPYGGGPGMLMKVRPLRAAITAAKFSLPTAKIISLSPQGELFNQATAQAFIQSNQALILVCGRYEGIDERLVQQDIDEEWSIGDYVLSGGEPAASVIVDALLRLLPGALGNKESAVQDSFARNLLDYPHYTRPKTIDGIGVPEVLLRGNHAEIAKWRLKQALGRTWLRRPELLKTAHLSKEEQLLLESFINEHRSG